MSLLVMMLVCYKVRTATGGLRIHNYTLHQCAIKLSLYLTCCIQKHVKIEIVSEVVGSQRTVLRKSFANLVIILVSRVCNTLCCQMSTFHSILTLF